MLYSTRIRSSWQTHHSRDSQDSRRSQASSEVHGKRETEDCLQCVEYFGIGQKFRHTSR